MNKITLPWREAHRNPIRTLLAVLSVTIGVAAVVSVRLGSTSAKEAFYKLQEAVTGKFDLEVVASDAAPFDASVAETVEKDPGVSAVAPLVLFRKAAIYAHGRRLVVSVVGIDETDFEALSQYEQQHGQPLGAFTDTEVMPSHSVDSDNTAAADSPERPIRARIPVLLESGFAKAIGKDVGDRLRMLLPRGPTSMEVVGIIALRSAAAFGAEGSVFFRQADLQGLIRAEGTIHQLRIVLDKGADTEVVRSRLAEQLGTGLEVRLPITRTELAADTLRGAEFALLFAQALAIVIAIFIIHNTFLISLGQRRRQWSILRAIGTTRGQLVRQVLVEALLLGLAGSALGLAVGWSGAQLLMQAIATLLQTPPASLQVDYRVLVFAALLGPSLTLFACYLPARKAARVSPIESMRGEEMFVEQRFPRIAVMLAGLTWTTSFGLLVLVMAERIEPLWSVPAGVLMMLGFVLVVPPVLGPLSRLINYLGLQRLWPAEGELAQRQMFRNHTRAVLTTAVLVVALGNGVGLGHAILNSVDDVRSWYQRAMSGDAVLTPTDPQRSAEFSLTARQTMESQIEAISGVRQAETVRAVPAQVRGLPTLAIAREFSAAQPLPWEAMGIGEEELRARLSQGQVVIGSALANRAGLSAGDVVRVEVAGDSSEFKIAFVTPDYVAGGLSVYVERNAAQRQLGIDGVDLFLLTLLDTDRAATEASLEAFCLANGLTHQSFADLRAFLDRIMAGVVAACWVVLILGFLVAGFGVFNTLAMNVLEQARDIGLMRIIGFTRAQVRRTILSEAVILSGLAVVLGTVAGLTTAVIMHKCMELLLARPMAFTWHIGFTILCNLTAIAIVIAAAGFPTRSATRTDMLGAIQYE